ncbi:MAG: hypothetical protein WAW73_02945 [Rhodoferax sp.]
MRLRLPYQLTAIAGIVTLLSACGGGSDQASAVAGGGSDVAQAAGRSSGSAIAQPANTAGRLLASNCFQCHGTLGRGGFDSIRGSDASEVVEYLRKPADSSIMAAHAQGYTTAQLQSIVNYLKQ